jgi:hypothetical protein
MDSQGRSATKSCIQPNNLAPNQSHDACGDAPAPPDQIEEQQFQPKLRFLEVPSSRSPPRAVKSLSVASEALNGKTRCGCYCAAIEETKFQDFHCSSEANLLESNQFLAETDTNSLSLSAEALPNSSWGDRYDGSDGVEVTREISLDYDTSDTQSVSLPPIGFCV